MAISGNPKKMAQDVAEGFLLLSPPVLKKYSTGDIRIILNNLALVQRELRQAQIPLEDIQGLKAKNTRLTRLNQAELVVRSYCKKMRIPI